MRPYQNFMFMTFLIDTSIKESKFELAFQMMVNKTIKARVDMFVGQLEQ